ncbi:hypothetical protein LUZ61_005424 [Rhynchospora tenuis]|uniref:Uncharacterized protein n=1 Tax=Rhynchospora tenuis TaxID=198213 RepID=A0AAD5ZPJ3_9POAL|nr:hypothetical protein LUZ61_005424 [Rhynchospora tenuis]
MNRFTSNNLIPGLIFLLCIIQIVGAGLLEYSAANRNVNSSSLQDEPGDDTGPIGASPPGPRIDCNFACARRCVMASRQNLCIRACGSCCLKCQCVPTGTSGNKEMCPCYASLLTHGLKPKCP